MEFCFVLGGMGSLKKQILELCNGIFVKSLPFKLNDLDLRIRFGPSQPLPWLHLAASLFCKKPAQLATR